jgi:hypothetical protein
MAKRTNESAVVNAWVRELLVKERDARIVNGEAPAAVDVGAAVWRTIRHKASIGDGTATAAINLYGQQRLVSIAGGVCRGEPVAARVYQNGDVVETTVTERYAIRPRTQDGTPDPSRERQALLWVDLSRADLLRLIADHQRQADKLEQNTAIFGRGLILMEAHPTATCVREACEMAGIDIEEFLLDA